MKLRPAGLASSNPRRRVHLGWITVAILAPVLASAGMSAAPGPLASTDQTQPRRVASGPLQWRMVRTSIGLTLDQPGVWQQVIDIDQDGDTDVLLHEVTFYADPSVAYKAALSVWENDGTGVFSRARKRKWLAGKPGRIDQMSNEQPMIHDFNGDGVPDIYFPQTGKDPADPAPGAANLLLLSRPDGRYRTARGEPYPRYDQAFTHHAAAADVDGDGDLDIWDANWPGSWRSTDPERAELGPRLLINDGSGGFRAENDRLPGPFPNSPDSRPCARGSEDCILPKVVFCDVDADGDQDLVGSPHPSDFDAPKLAGRTQILENDGFGNFNYSKITLPLSPNGVNSEYGSAPVCADLDMDGDPDLLVATETSGGRGPPNPHLQFLQNRGKGRFRDVTKKWLPQSLEADGHTGGSISIVDLDNDGWPDIVLPGERGMSGTIFRNLGKGRFEQLAVPGDIGFQITPLDANGDGRIDLLVVMWDASINADRYVILFNETQ